jgi:hypothetical protein
MAKVATGSEDIKMPSAEKIKAACVDLFVATKQLVERELSHLLPQSASVIYDSWTTVATKNLTAYALQYVCEDWTMKRILLGIEETKGLSSYSWRCLVSQLEMSHSVLALIFHPL